MLALLTSCNRYDLLKTTLKSLFDNQTSGIDLVIHEDSIDAHSYTLNAICREYNVNIMYTGGVGQHASIEQFLNYSRGKYYLHLEDDWEFLNTYDWIMESIKIMEEDQTIIKVLCRNGSPHPCEHDAGKGFGYLNPWQSDDGILWHGFSWNPGVTRLDLLKQFTPFPKWEQDLAKNIYDAGYKVVELIKPIYKHIGDGRSTH